MENKVNWTEVKIKGNNIGKRVQGKESFSSRFGYYAAIIVAEIANRYCQIQMKQGIMRNFEITNASNKAE